MLLETAGVLEIFFKHKIFVRKTFYVIQRQEETVRTKYYNLLKAIIKYRLNELHNIDQKNVLLKECIQTLAHLKS